MHTVDIGIGCNNHLLITQVLDIVINIECVVEELKLVICVCLRLLFAKSVEWLTTQRKYSLCKCVTRLGNRTRCRVTLGNEDHCLRSQLIFVTAVNLTVAQVLIVKQQSLICLAALLLHARHSLTLLLTLDNLALDNLRHLWISVEVVIKLNGKILANKLTHRDTLRCIFATELRLYLVLKDRI